MSQQASTPRPASRLAALRNVGIFLAAFALGVLGLRRVLPDPSGEIIDTKLDYFERTVDRWDLIFLGSSRAYRGFVPELFDRAMAEAGHPLTSFNFGLLGARTSEILEILRELERLQPARLKWILIDPEALNLLVRNERMLTRREIDWHEAGLTLDVVRLTLSMPLEPAERRDILLHHARAFVYDHLNVGKGEPIARRLLGRSWLLEERGVLGPRLDGYDPHMPSLPERAAAGERGAAAALAQYGRRVAALSALQRPRGDLPTVRAAFYRRLEEACRRLGAEPVFVILPTVVNRHELPRAHAQGYVETLFDYGDPNRWAALYEVDQRYDVGHANDRGAKLFTRILAADFARHLDETAAAGGADG